MVTATRKWERTALKWRALSERRRAHFHDLYSSGRWRHYYTDEEFLKAMRETNAIADRWALIAPLPEEQAAAAARFVAAEEPPLRPAAAAPAASERPVAA